MNRSRYCSSPASSPPPRKLFKKSNNVGGLSKKHLIEYDKLVVEEKRILDRIKQLEEELSKLKGANNSNIGLDGLQISLSNSLTLQSGKESFELTYDDIDWKQYEAPEWCIPIKANVLDFDFKSLGKECQFDVILMDPPWQLATHAPTRGVAIGYQQLPDTCIEDLPIPELQTNGFIFIWVINNKYYKAFELMERWGYHYVEDITWVKQTVNRRMAKGHGYYLQHAKETCLVGKKGRDPPHCRTSISSDVIYAERRGQSQKPIQLYEMIEELVPKGKYLEIFGRKNNLRDFWVTIGNEL